MGVGDGVAALSTGPLCPLCPRARDSCAAETPGLLAGAPESRAFPVQDSKGVEPSHQLKKLLEGQPSQPAGPCCIRTQFTPPPPPPLPPTFLPAPSSLALLHLRTRPPTILLKSCPCPPRTGGRPPCAPRPPSASRIARRACPTSVRPGGTSCSAGPGEDLLLLLQVGLPELEGLAARGRLGTGGLGT